MLSFGRTAVLIFCLILLGLTTNIFAQALPTAASNPAILEMIQTILDPKGVLKDARIGIMVQALEDGRELYAVQPDRSMIPASLTKLVTAVAAGYGLQNTFSFVTQLRTDAGKIGPVLNRNLYLVGGGDPTLTTGDLAGLARHLAESGVKTIHGDLFADLSFIAKQPQDDSQGNLFTQNIFPPISALSINGNRITIGVKPGESIDQPALVKMLYGPDSFNIENKITTGPSGSLPNLRARFHQATVTVMGSIAADSPGDSVGCYVDDPDFLSLSIFRQELERTGIAFEGKINRGRCPKTSLLISQTASPPLADILVRLLTRDDDFTAEMMLQTLGAISYGPPGSSQSGLRALQERLNSMKVKSAGLTVHDGSGLSTANRISPRFITRLLAAAYKNPELQFDLVSALPVAGQSKSLNQRFAGEEMPGVLMLLTGRQPGVVGLAGYFWTPGGKPRAFALMINDYPLNLSEADATRLADKLAVLLMEIERPADDAP